MEAVAATADGPTRERVTRTPRVHVAAPYGAEKVEVDEGATEVLVPASVAAP